MAGRKKRTQREPLTEPVTPIGAAPSKRVKKGGRHAPSQVTADRREPVEERAVDIGQLGRVIRIKPVEVEGEEYEIPREVLRLMPNPGLAPKHKQSGERGRKARHRESVIRLSRHLQGEGVPKDLADEAADEWVADREHLPGYEKLWEEWAPSSTSPNRLDIREECEYAAVYRQPVVGWLREWMCTRKQGRPAQRGQVVDALFHQAWGMGRPSVRASRKAFAAGHTLLSWAFDTPQVTLSENGYTESQASMIADKPAVACVAVALDLFRQIADLRDEKGKLRFPKAGRVCAVDGTKVEADVRQFFPRYKALRDLIRGKGRDMVDVCVYGDGDGRPKDAWVGYKLVIISCMDTGLPLVWSLVPAQATERDEALKLIRTLYQLWPDAPIEALVGDSHYDQSEEFARELVFKYGIAPIFVQHGEFGQEWAHAHGTSGELGVPKCKHGLMKYGWVDGAVTPTKRKKEGLGPGEPAPTGARIRWRCPLWKDHPDQACETIGTCINDNPRLYTAYPRAGESKQRVLREVWLARRGSIESLNGLVKHRGLAGRNQERARKASDKRMDWLLSLGLLYIVGRRLAHENGDYQRCCEEAETLGLTANPSPEQLAPGPDDSSTYPEMLANRDEEWGPIREPQSLAIDLDGYYAIGKRRVTWAVDQAA